jgi:hypothetical protein
MPQVMATSINSLMPPCQLHCTHWLNSLLQLSTSNSGRLLALAYKSSALKAQKTTLSCRMYHHFFFSKGPCLSHLWSISPASPWLSSHIAPSLALPIPSRFLIRCQVNKVYSFYFFLWRKASKCDWCSHISSTYAVYRLFLWFRWPTLPQSPVTLFSNPHGRPNSFFRNLQH